MYVNGRQVAADTIGSTNREVYAYGQPMYIGRASSQGSGKRYGDITIDDLQLWEASRDVLISKNYFPQPPEVEPTEPGLSRAGKISNTSSLRSSFYHASRHTPTGELRMWIILKMYIIPNVNVGDT